MVINIMTIYALGDIHGCISPLTELLAVIERETPGARLWFAGDLVNRGPASLETLRRIRALGERAVAVLGNHDLHLLAVAAGIRPMKPWDSLEPILSAPDREALLEWVRYRPLAYTEGGFLLVHAGVLPQWDLDKTMALAHEVEQVLRGPDWKDFLAEMYGNLPDCWDDNLSGSARLRCIVNGLTRLRFCTAQGQMEFSAKLGDSATNLFRLGREILFIIKTDRLHFLVLSVRKTTIDQYNQNRQNNTSRNDIFANGYVLFPKDIIRMGLFCGSFIKAY